MLAVAAYAGYSPGSDTLMNSNEICPLQTAPIPVPSSCIKNKPFKDISDQQHRSVPLHSGSPVRGD